MAKMSQPVIVMVIYQSSNKHVIVYYDEATSMQADACLHADKHLAWFTLFISFIFVSRL